MNIEQKGSFLIPEGTSLEDLGGKAQRLIEYQELARKHGFWLPDAFALPWQTFSDIPKRKCIGYDFGLKKYDAYPHIDRDDFNVV
ncbi:MAG: hypothetical protein Q8O36_00530, partial [Candidatus Omnitrophota bacterium]|nr:hypothetical protein [Candidatus Omnitrophota bacterium]